jgi:hypothetical protein
MAGEDLFPGDDVPTKFKNGFSQYNLQTSMHEKRDINWISLVPPVAIWQSCRDLGCHWLIRKSGFIAAVGLPSTLKSRVDDQIHDRIIPMLSCVRGIPNKDGISTRSR